MRILILVILKITLITCVFAENSWNVNPSNTVIILKLAKNEGKEITSHEYKTISITISNKGDLECFNEINFFILDTTPKSLCVTSGDIFKNGIKRFHFDKDKGVLEIEFNEMTDIGIITTTPLLVIARGYPIKNSELCSERYTCNATLSYQSRFTSQTIESIGGHAWLSGWSLKEYKTVSDIFLPSAKISP